MENYQPQKNYNSKEILKNTGLVFIVAGGITAITEALAQDKPYTSTPDTSKQITLTKEDIKQNYSRGTIEEQIKKINPDLMTDGGEAIDKNKLDTLKDVFRGSFDKDWENGEYGKAFILIPTRVAGTAVGMPYDIPKSLIGTGKDTGHLIKYGLDEKEDSALAKFARFLASPAEYAAIHVIKIGKGFKEEPVQSTLDLATYAGVGFGIHKATEGKNTNRSGSGSGSGLGGP